MSDKRVEAERLREAARAIYERALTAEEFQARVADELSDEARAEKLSLIAWFTRRYPTPASRIAYARRLRNGRRLQALRRR
ncbi:MAG: hypothetical protein EXR72_00870 [Myxococcales bacterium]|nr:hypothetical protein [Myxococcales bacterium]